MRQNHYFIKLFMLTVMAFFAGNVMAEEAVFDFTSVEGLKAMGVAEANIPQATDAGVGFDTNGPFSINEVTIETTNGGTPSRLWSTKNNGSRDYRVYTNGTMTITAPSGKNLSKIVFTAGSWTEPTASEGNISGKEWNGNASSLTLTMKGQCQFKTITVTFGDASSIVTKKSADLSFSVDKVELTLGETSFTQPTLNKATNAEVKYSSTNTSIATVDESTGVVTITATAAGTAKIRATAEENDEYYAGQAEYQIIVKEAAIGVADIAAMNALEDKTEFLFNGKVTVVYASGKYVYIKDDTGSSLLFKEDLGVEKGDVIKAGWKGKVSVYNNLFEVVPSTTLEKDGTAEVAYPVATAADVKAENMNQVVVLKGVTYTALSGKNFTIGDDIAGYNQFGISIPTPEEGATYDIEGVISVFKTNVQFQPISITAHTHNFIEAGRTDPTCTETGSITNVCECGETQTEEIPALGHDMVDGVCSRCGFTETPELKVLYIMGTGTENEWSNTTAMTLNEETDAFEYDLTLTSTGYITFGDVAFTDWDDFNANHRYGIGEGDVNATLDTPTKLEKYNGCLVIAEAGKYKVTVTKDLVVTITKTGDVTITAEISRVQICGATDPEWSNRIDFDLTKGEGEEEVYTGVLDLTGSTNDVEFKLVVNEGTWIGFNELTLDAPEGWVEGPNGDGNNFMLKNADTGYRTYTVTATWVANADASANWTLKIEGKDMAETELEVPGTEIWSSEEAADVDWNQGKAAMIDAENFADVKVGDRLNIGILGAPEDAAPSNWAYQVALQDGDNWKNLEGGEPLKQAGDYVHSFIITGDMLRYLKQDGLALNGTKFQVKKVAVESAYEGSDESIFVGEKKGNVQINICHFANAADFTGVKVGDIIRVTIDSPNWIGINYNTTDWKWSNFADDDFKVTNDYTNPVVEFTIKTDNAVNILNKENGGIFINNPNVTVTQVEIIPAVLYTVTVSESEGGKVTADMAEALEGDAVTLTVTPDEGYELDKLTVKDADDADVEVTENSFTMPASNVTVTAIFKRIPGEVNITIESGKDIAEEVAAAAGGAPIKSLTITLEEDGEYTISNSLTTQGSVVINGNGATIDASGLTKPFIAFSAEPGIEPVASGQYVIEDPIMVDNVIVNGLTKALFADNGKSYAYVNLTVQNSLFHYTTQSNVVFNFAASMAINFNILNSTFYSDAPGTKNFIAMSGKRPWQITGFEEETGKFTCDHNTFYNVAKGNQFMNTNSLKGQKYLYEFNSNIFVDVSNKKIYGNMTNNTKQLTTDGLNTYMWDGAFFNETNYNGDEGLQTDPGFADAANGDFTLAVTSDQYAQQTGDPRWLGVDPTVMVAPESGDFAAIVAQAVKEGKETLALPAGAAYKAGSTIKVDKKLNIIGDEDDPATLELGMKGFVIKDAIDMENMIIDAATNAEPFIALSDEPNEELLGANNGSNYYNIMDQLILRNLTITGVKGKLLYDNNKPYALDYMLIENCIIQLRTPKEKMETVIFMQGGGIRMLEVNTSTIYQKGQGDNDFFVRYNNSARLDRMGYITDNEKEGYVEDKATQGFIYESNTFYKVAYQGQWGNYSGFAGRNYTSFTVNKNIWVDCGKQEVARRMLGGRPASSYEVCEFDQNTYIYNGSAETEGTMKNGEPVGTYDVSGTAITKAPTFKLVATGDFTLDANDVQNKQQTGDPRWFAEEEATGIVNVNANVNDSQDAPAYNLAGQRVNANTAKGIIIKNGRKYVK